MTTELNTNLSSPEVASESLAHNELDDSESLADEVADIVQDPSYSHSDIIRTMNVGLRYIAGRVLLPELEAWADLETDPNVNHIPLPADYQKNLRYCHSVTHNRQVRIVGSLLQSYRQFSELDQGGRVVHVMPKGRSLYYQRVPSTAETLRIAYYKYPDRLFSRWEKPTCLPVHLTHELLVSYAAWKLFSKIEDGVEGQKVNTQYYKGLFDIAMAELTFFLGPEEREPVEVSNEIDWEAYLG